MVSQVDELTITALNHVGSNPNGPVSKDCVYVVANTVTPEGQGIARLGWAVTAEIEWNGLTFVSFAGRAEAGTSGSCLLSDGNIGIFRAGRMEGLIYAAPGAKRGIGIVAPIEDGLRVWDGDFLQRPLADLQLHGDDLVVVSAVAGRDMFCDGMVSVPNIYGIPIHLARRLLLAEGWVPQPPDVVPSLMMTDLPELLDSAGTGFAACTYLYRSAEAPELMVTTAGEAELRRHLLWCVMTSAACNRPAATEAQGACMAGLTLANCPHDTRHRQRPCGHLARSFGFGPLGRWA